MTPDEIAQATTLLARRTDLQARLARVSQATSLMAVADVLTGTGFEDSILSQSRTNVADFLGVSIAEVEAQLLGLGVQL